MKKKSCLINIGRGNAIDEISLVEHLKQNKNFFVYLDVFKNEPLKTSSNFGAYQMFLLLRMLQELQQ